MEQFLLHAFPGTASNLYISQLEQSPVCWDKSTFL